MELGYSIPAEIVVIVGLSNFRVYFNGLNMFTWDKLKVFDPEADKSTGFD